MADKNRYRRTYPVSWDQLHRDSRALAWRLIDSGKSWDKISQSSGAVWCRLR